MGKWTWLVCSGCFAAWIVAAGFVNLYEQVVACERVVQCAGTDARSATRLLGMLVAHFGVGCSSSADHGEGIRDGKR